MPKIVVLDGYTSNPGDLDWSMLETEAAGDLTVFERTLPGETVERIGDAEIVLTNKVILSKDVIHACSSIQYIGVLATGYNVVDLDAAKERGIVVTNIPGYSTASVAQLVFSHLLNMTQNVAGHAETVRAGDWAKSPDFCYWVSPLIELSGKTIGLVGFGKTARAVAEIAKAFGMRVLYSKPNRLDSDPEGVSYVGLETLFRESDVVSLHCPLTESSYHLVNKESLSWMKPSAFLINTGRGDLVDESALCETLKSRAIAGAGLDVTHKEPIEHDNPLTKLDNCFITPHIAWASLESRKRLIDIAAQNVRDFLNGNPQNVVS